MGHLLVIGGYGIGMSFFCDHAPRDGETISGARLSEEHGGKASNQAVAAARLGTSVSLITALGTDGRDAAARALWDAEGVDHAATFLLDGTTMVGAIITDASGENRIILADGVLAEITGAQMAEAITRAPRTDLALISCEIGDEAIEAAVRTLHAHQVPVVLNPAPVPHLPAEVWRMIDTITPNETEADTLIRSLDPEADPSGPQDRARRLAALLDAHVVMTLGAQGSVVVERTDTTTAHDVAPVPVAQAVDTTGAGDSFNAALASALLAGRPLTEAARLAAHASACTVEHEGVIPALPSAAQLSARFGLHL